MDFAKVFKDYRFQPRTEQGKWRREILPASDRFIPERKEDRLVRSGSGTGMLLLKGNIDQPRDDSGRWASSGGSNEGRSESPPSGVSNVGGGDTAQVGEKGLALFKDMGFATHPNWKDGNTLVASGNKVDAVHTKFRTEGWTKLPKEGGVQWYRHPTEDLIAEVELGRGSFVGKTLLGFLPGRLG